MRLRMRDQREPAVMRNIQPLMPIRRPRVRAFTPRTKCRYFALAAAHNPNAPSTCTHAPCRFASGISVSKSSHEPVLISPACSTTITGAPDYPFQRRFQRRSLHSTHRVCRKIHHLRAPKSQQPQRPRHRSMPRLTRQNPNLRRAAQPLSPPDPNPSPSAPNAEPPPAHVTCAIWHPLTSA
jgi:hypothetical protein